MLLRVHRLSPSAALCMGFQRVSSSLTHVPPQPRPTPQGAPEGRSPAGSTGRASPAPTTPASLVARWRMRKSAASLSPVQRAAAIAHDDLAELTRCLEDDGSAAAPAAGAPQLGGFSDGRPNPFLPLHGGGTASQQEQPSQGARVRKLGALQRVPVVAPSNECLSSALKRASKVAYSSNIKNEAEKERNRAARQMDTLMKELSVPLSNYCKTFPEPSRLHPFEAALLQLTVSQGSYLSTLGKVDALRKAVQEVGKSYANRAANASNKQSALEVAIEGCEAIERVYRKGAKSVDDLKEIAKKLRALPSVDTTLPTLALVGAPNVGKSSLVRVLSSGIPEVCNYPFTTRSIKMGHFYLDGRKHQVTDTPGVMSRDDDERNKMELLTLAALDCLPTSVLFVMDLTEECGTSISDQWAIRRELRVRYQDKPWIDAFSKCDMLEKELEQAASYRWQLQQSLHGDEGQTELSLQGEVNQGSASAPGLHSAQQGKGTRNGDGASCLEEVEEVFGDAAEVAARLPEALPVSSKTEQGIEALQAAIVDLFSRQQAEKASAALAAASFSDESSFLGVAE